MPQSIAHNFGAENQKLTHRYSPSKSSHSSLKTTVWWQELHAAPTLRRRPAEGKNGFASSLLLVVSSN